MTNLHDDMIDFLSVETIRCCNSGVMIEAGLDSSLTNAHAALSSYLENLTAFSFHHQSETRLIKELSVSSSI